MVEGGGGRYPTAYQTPTQRSDPFHRDFFGYIAHLNHFVSLLERPEFQGEINKARDSFAVYRDLVRRRRQEVQRHLNVVRQQKEVQAAVTAAAAAAAKQIRSTACAHAGFLAVDVHPAPKRGKFERAGASAVPGPAAFLSQEEDAPSSPPYEGADGADVVENSSADFPDGEPAAV